MEVYQLSPPSHTHNTSTNHTQRSSSRSGSRSRRSYPSLNQISLTPLNPRYPIDDDDDDDDGDNGNGHVNDDDQSQGYYSARSTSPDHPYSAGASTPRTRTPPSYLYSFSVPGTPGLLSQSHSRSASRTRARHGRTKSSSRSSTGGLNSSGNTGSGTPSGRKTPGHHQSSGSTGGSRGGRPDSEWMLRTGIALAESTREEKGQSWLVKRQSSTSLASDSNNNGNNNNYESTGITTCASSRPRSSKSRASSSGMSTPRRGSRRSSRPDLSMTMTGLEMTSHTRVATPPSASDDQSRGFRPDAVDARIRAEMALIQQQQQQQKQQQQEEDRDIDKDGAWSGAEDDDYDDFNDDDDDGWSLDSADEIDEKEMQRLTRERGFGLGSWLDRMVEWTLFGVDEWPSLAASAEDPPAAVEEDTAGTPHLRDQVKDAYTTGGPGDDGCSLAGDTEDNSSLSDNDDKSSVNLVEKPGEKGGWEDARWLLHAVRRALFP